MFFSAHSVRLRAGRSLAACLLLASQLAVLPLWGCQREDPNASTGEFGDRTEKSTTEGLPSGTGSGNATEPGGTGTGLSGGGLMNNRSDTGSSAGQ